MSSRRQITRASAIVALAAAATVGITACSGNSTESHSTSEPAVTSTEAPSASNLQSAPEATAPSAGATDKTADSRDHSVASQPKRLQRKATLALTVTDVHKASAKVRSTASSFDGQVSFEQISDDATIVVEVPTDRLDEALDALAAVGEVDDRTLSTTDVTGQYVDTESRIRSAKASVARIRALMTKADKLSDIVSLESELSTRQSDLESLQSQLDRLASTTAMAPITVTLSLEASESTKRAEDQGFLSGLTSGWDALTTILAAAATALGVLTPFLVALAIIGAAPIWFLRRRLTARTPRGSARPLE